MKLQALLKRDDSGRLPSGLSIHVGMKPKYLAV